MLSEEPGPLQYFDGRTSTEDALRAAAEHLEVDDATLRGLIDYALLTPVGVR